MQRYFIIDDNNYSMDKSRSNHPKQSPFGMNKSNERSFNIREIKPSDFVEIEDMLKENGMLTFPSVDGARGMISVYKKNKKYFLVAENNGRVVGFIRGCYDGSRALVQQMLVDKQHRDIFVGKKLLHEIAVRFKSDGASTIAVTASHSSKAYFKKLGFTEFPVKLLVAPDINKVIKRILNSLN